MRHPAIRKILAHYKKLADQGNHPWMYWAKQPIQISKKEADEIFLGVLLDQGQKAERAWNGSKHLIKNHFKHPKGFWHGVSESSQEEVNRICTSGYDGKSYAVNFQTNKFPLWLKKAADRMLADYQGDPRKIWEVSPENVSLIYARLMCFDGIGDALAKMGQFILVRNYGVAGGSASQHMMAIKPDELVRRVMYRTGVSSSPNTKTVIESTHNLCLKSPADFDAAAWIIGREYCSKTSPRCDECPISGECARVGLLSRSA